MIFEACVDSYASAKAAYLGGADRIELCGCLFVGGVTPSLALFDEIKRDFPIPVFVLIRPRGGDFLYSRAELSQMRAEITLFRDRGAEGVVIGALNKEGDLDEEALSSMIERAGKRGKVTLHRAFDKCRSPLQALEKAEKLGFDTVLTSGQRPSAVEGIPLLRELVSNAKGIEIMAGGGVRKENIQKIYLETHVSCFHASCRREEKSKMQFLRPEVNMGFPGVDENTLFLTDEEEVSSCARIVHGL